MLFKIKNITFSLHYSVLYLILIFLASGVSSGLSENNLLQGLLRGLLSFVILMVSLVLHELAHVRVAQKLGILNRGHIILWGLGGLALMPGLERVKPKDELLIAGAGPLLSLIILFLGLVINFLLGFDVKMVEQKEWLPWILAVIIIDNLFIAAFNLLPAFPMDGGRILRATLAFFTSKATKIAVTISRIFALLFCVAAFVLFYYGAIIGALSLLATVVFLWLAGSAELKLGK